MKKLFLLFLLGVSVMFMSCQQDLDFASDSNLLQTNEKSITDLKIRTVSDVVPQFMPLDSIPEWAKAKLTLEEYNLWNILNKKFNIDYSFLNDDRYITRRSKINDNLKQLCENIKKNECCDYYGNFSVLYLGRKNRIERLSRTETTPDNSISASIHTEGDVFYWFTAIYDIIVANGGKTIYVQKASFTCGPSYKKVHFYGSENYRVEPGTCRMWVKSVGKLEYDNKVVDIDYYQSFMLSSGLD